MSAREAIRSLRERGILMFDGKIIDLITMLASVGLLVLELLDKTDKDN